VNVCVLQKKKSNTRFEKGFDTPDKVTTILKSYQFAVLSISSSNRCTSVKVGFS
jgi:hypothetical protein